MNSTDLTNFNRAIQLAQSGSKAQAYQSLKALYQFNPGEANILLWIAFTTPDLTEAEAMIAEATRLEPSNPSLVGARQWLVSQRPNGTLSPSVSPVATSTNTFQRELPSLDSTLTKLSQLPPSSTPQADAGSTLEPTASFSKPGTREKDYYSNEERFAKFQELKKLLPWWGWAGAGLVVLGLLALILLLVFGSSSYGTVGNRIIVPSDGSYPGDLAVLDKVIKNSDSFKSVRATIVTKDTNGENNADITLVQPDRLYIELTPTKGQHLYIILIGQDLYVSQNNLFYRKNPSGTQDFNKLVTALKEPFDIRQYAGSTFIVQPDENLAGQDVGVLELDTVNATGQKAKALNGAKIYFRYDKQSFRMKEQATKSGQAETTIRFLVYDQPNATITQPPLSENPADLIPPTAGPNPVRPAKTPPVTLPPATTPAPSSKKPKIAQCRDGTYQGESSPSQYPCSDHGGFDHWVIS